MYSFYIDGLYYIEKADPDTVFARFIRWIVDCKWEGMATGRLITPHMMKTIIKNLQYNSI